MTSQNGSAEANVSFLSFNWKISLQVRNHRPLLQAQQLLPQGYKGHKLRAYEMLVCAHKSLLYLCCHPFYLFYQYSNAVASDYYSTASLVAALATAIIFVLNVRLLSIVMHAEKISYGNTRSIETNVFGTSTSIIPTALRQLIVTLLRSEILTCSF